MTLEESFLGMSPCVVGFITRFKKTRVGQRPIFPTIFGTGFFVDKTGIVATNRHVVELFDKIPRHPQTGESGLGAIMFLRGDNDKSMQMLHVGVRGWFLLQEFTSTTTWYGQVVPDIGYVQLDVREVSFLKLATRDYFVRVGMHIATIGFPMGDLPLTALGKLNQVTPFLRQGIVSSVFPFPTAQPHGFTIDIMQQGGSSGSPIFEAGEGAVVGMMSSSVVDWMSVQSDQLSLAVSQNTNISIAEASSTIQAGLAAFKTKVQLNMEGVPTLAELRARSPEGSTPETLTWDSLGRGDIFG